MTADLDRVLARKGIRRGKAGAKTRIDAMSVKRIDDLAEECRPCGRLGYGLAVYSLEDSVADGVCLGTRYTNECHTALALGRRNGGDRAEFCAEKLHLLPRASEIVTSG